ncbi:MAG TPA: TonB-dependent receptor plug domain-containing protein, partial [Longimicrobiaceae bacterium]|nr:TonB-dependent receptor plug domain-containing protein [Longimicrobiaceae bacterium]
MKRPQAALLLAALAAPAALHGQTVERTVPARDTLIAAPVPRATLLPAVVVTGWRFGARGADGQSLSRADWENAPQPGEDPFRMVGRLPGVTSSDESARFHVRGGANEELLVRIDGLELVEPFHVKEFEGGAISVVDAAALGGVELLTGGFTAEYGDRLTGVFDMRTAAPPAAGTRTELGLSLTNARYLGRGGFGEGRGGWMLSARRGYLDLVLDMVHAARTDGNYFVPRYGDAMGKVQWRLSPRHEISLHALWAGDRFSARDRQTLLAHTRYSDGYAWATWTGQYGGGLGSETVASTGRLTWDRGGTWTRDRAGTDASDQRTLRFGALRQDWTWALAPRAALKWGWEAKQQAAEYDYRSVRVTHTAQDGVVTARTDTVRMLRSPDGSALGGYLAGRVQPVAPLTVEAGVRLDRQSWTGDRDVSPRVNAALALGPATTVRAAWGMYAQAQAIHALQVQDGIGTFGPSERAEHRVLGIEHAAKGVSYRAEAYQRVLTRQRPRFANLNRSFDIFPEVEGDRVLLSPVDGQARGIELFAQRSDDRPVRWWAGYSLAQVRQTYATFTAPGDADQRHTVHLGGAYVPSARWRLSAAWEFHTGLPITGATFQSGRAADGTLWVKTIRGPLYGERLPAYHRMDLRLTRSWANRHGAGTAFLDVFNLYNQQNSRAYSYSYSP